MTIQVGDRLPQATFRVMTADGPVARTTDDIFRERKVVLVAVPGAFTPTCDRNHLPGYVTNAEVIRARGIDAIVVTAVNDVFVLDAWSKASGAGEEGIEFLADGNGDFARALGLTYEGVANGLGTRSQRYSMMVEDGVVRVLNIEDAPSKADISGVDNLLRTMGAVLP
jgi:glutaredoxin/glutathione-dependent peroxiredoxin